MSETADIVIHLENISLSFPLPGRMIQALNDISVDVKAGQITGLIGPDGAGKTTLMRLLTGLLPADSGFASVMGFDISQEPLQIQSAVGYMPQRFGLYEDLTVRENMNLYADLHNVPKNQRQARYEKLLQMTRMAPFNDRLAGKLSGGMKQKLGLACTLVNPPRLLLLDEPTVGVDPVSRKELWRIIYQLVEEEQITIILSTAYLDEAERCHDVLLIHEGRVLGQGSPESFSKPMQGRTFLASSASLPKRRLQTRLSQTAGVLDALIENDKIRLVLNESGVSVLNSQIDDLSIIATPPRFEDAFIARLKVKQDLSTAKTKSNTKPEFDTLPGFNENTNVQNADSTVIEVTTVTRYFGDFCAVNGLSFIVRKGEVFGLLGANGAGKTTMFRMLCGLLPVGEGKIKVAGHDLRNAASRARSRIGYMAQKFSLYTNLTVKQNLNFFSSAYGLSGAYKKERIQWALDEFDLADYFDVNCGDMPLGYKQRLAFAAALMHEPEILFLDEPTSGVDPLARREFWQRTNALAESGVTVLVTTHFMDEANYCDRLIIMADGAELSSGTPGEIRSHVRSKENPEPSMEDAFISMVENRKKSL